MKEMILNTLQALGMDAYSLTETRRASAELFFIRRNLDMRRMKEVTEYEVTLYRDFTEGDKRYLGASQVLLFPGMGEEEVSALLKSAYAAAGYAKNPWYPLYEGPKAPMKEMPSTLSGQSPEESAQSMADALFSADVREDAFINSAEIFVNRQETRILTSTGTDVAFGKYECSGEFVVQAKEPQDVEQYFSFRYEDLDQEALREKAAKALTTVCDRAHAQDYPKAGVYDVVLSGEHVATLLSLYSDRSHASMLYPKYSDWQVGTEAQGEITTGEALNLTLVPSAPYSPEGIPMTERTLLKEGRVECIHGGNRFCRYLGVEPTGDYRRVRLDNGTVPFEEMKKGTLYPVSFSDFQMDSFSGYFGGEIRLAYLFTEQGVELRTGGSINGSLFDKQGQLTFSKERYKDAAYEGPLAVRIPGVSVNGK